jgi:hypothetical protein
MIGYSMPIRVVSRVFFQLGVDASFWPAMT